MWSLLLVWQKLYIDFNPTSFLYIHQKAEIDELETNSKIKNIRDLYRDINNIKNGYHPRTDIVRNEKSDLVTDSLSSLVR
jgi:hypothetical protein